MANLKKRHFFVGGDLSSKSYFLALLKAGLGTGILSESFLEKIQLQFLDLLAYKCKRYNLGDSSSIRVEAAESIMNSILYTIGIYLKSLPDIELAINQLEETYLSEIYDKGRELLTTKIDSAKERFETIKDNKLSTLNSTYNDTIENGIGLFFAAYDPEFEAHDTPGSIDYQLCNPVTGLSGIEFIEKYLESLLLENEFCRLFAAEDIHYLLSGYDKRYKDLLLNIFEHTLTNALGCALASCSVRGLNLQAEDIQLVARLLTDETEASIERKLSTAAEAVVKELEITNPALRKYISKSLSKIVLNIKQALRTNTVDQIFVSFVNPDLEPKIQFLSKPKMEDEEYRKLIDDLLECRYSTDKLVLIKKKVKSFDDLEDLLFDAYLGPEEMIEVFGMFNDLELAMLIKRHPYNSKIQAVDLEENERILRTNLKKYLDKLPQLRRERVSKLVKQLADDM